MANNSTAVSNVIPFRFEAKEVRTILIDDQPWFVAADVCASLAISNVSLAVNGRADRESDGLDIDEKGVATVNTPSGDQEMLVVNESGLYSLIFKSRKAEAKRFKKWVTSEVLPTIRKNGSYEDSRGALATLVGDVIGSTGEVVLNRVIEQKGYRIAPSMQRSFKHTMKSRLRSRFNVQKASLIPADQMEAACNFIAAYAIEGEWIGKPEKVDGGIHLSAHETHCLYLLMSRFVSMHKHKNQMLSAARALGSDCLMSMFDQLHDGHISFFTLDKRRDEIYAAYTSTGCQGGYASRMSA